MRGNKINSSLSVHAGQMKSGGKHYGRAWGEYQAVGGYRPAAQPRNPTPGDKKQEMSYQRKIGEVYKSVPNRTKTNVYRQTRYGS